MKPHSQIEGKYYASSALKPDKLGTSPAARADRARKAIAAAGLRFSWPLVVRALGQASSSEITIGSVVCLVSYETIVAYRLADGSEAATPRNHYSKTTDRALDDWLHTRDCVRLEPEALHERLRARFAS